MSRAIEDVQASSLSQGLKALYLEHAVLSLPSATGLGNGKPIAAHPVGALGSAEPLTLTSRGQASCYSLFGRLGQGLGGFTVKAKLGEAVGLGEGVTLLQAKACGGFWVHFLKAIGAPALTASKSHSAYQFWWSFARIKLIPRQLGFFLRPRFAN